MLTSHGTSDLASNLATDAPLSTSKPAGAAPVVDSAYSNYKIIRRNGAVVGFEPSKIAVAMTKAFLAVNGGQGAASARIRELVEQMTGSVVNALVRRQPSGGIFHIEDIQDQVELALMRSGEAEVARAYVLYRERRAQERAAKQAKLDAVSNEASALEIKASFLFSAAANTLETQQREAYLKEARQCRDRAAALREQEVPMRATLNTMPSSDGSLLKSMARYDQQFMEDSQRVLSKDKSTLTGFDKLLREAWDEPALKDPELIAFFDDYVIDSLAAFDTDRTRATEARVLYQGGDERLKYALLNGEDDTSRHAA